MSSLKHLMEKVVLDYSLQGSALFLLHRRENFMLITKKMDDKEKTKTIKSLSQVFFL